MAKLTKKEKEQIERQTKQQMGYKSDRGPTWVGIRPSIMMDKKQKTMDELSDKKTVDKEINDLDKDVFITIKNNKDIDVGKCKDIEGITVNGISLSAYSVQKEKSFDEILEDAKKRITKNDKENSIKNKSEMSLDFT